MILTSNSKLTTISYFFLTIIFPWLYLWVLKYVNQFIVNRSEIKPFLFLLQASSTALRAVISFQAELEMSCKASATQDSIGKNL